MKDHKSTETHDCDMCQHVTSLIISLPPESISMSASIDKLAVALIKATGDMGFIKKDKGGAERGGKKIYYADINAVLEESKPHLKQHGLSLLQPLFSDSTGAHRMGSLLIHESGQFISSSMIMEKNQLNMQQFGGDITYMRRYSCVSLLGIAQEDNDGSVYEKEPISIPSPVRTEAREVQQSFDGGDLVSEKQVKFISFQIGQNRELLHHILQKYGIQNIQSMKKSDAQHALAYIESQKNK